MHQLIFMNIMTLTQKDLPSGRVFIPEGIHPETVNTKKEKQRTI